MVRTHVSQFDGSQDCFKVREEGVEQEWVELGSPLYKTTIWQTINGRTFKEITYTDTRRDHVKDPNVKSGHREGTNELGQYWKEDWERNDVTGYLRWNKMT
jgi:hypothetical protein